jgi:hypothetical protein
MSDRDERLARLRVMLEHALSEVAALEFGVATHDGSVMPDLTTAGMCCDDEPPSNPV